MSVNFPTMIDWIESVGFETLHEMQEDFKCQHEKFSTFVQRIYEEQKTDWRNEIGFSRKLKIDFDAFENNVSMLEAVSLFKEIVEESIGKKIFYKITLNDVIPDHNCALNVVNDFWNKVIPAVEKALNELGEEN